MEEGEENDEQGSGLLVELEGKEEKKKRETDLWFSKVCLIVWSTEEVILTALLGLLPATSS